MRLASANKMHKMGLLEVPKTECWKAMRQEGWKHHEETRTDYSPDCLVGRKRIPKEWIEYHRNKDENLHEENTESDDTGV